MMGRILKPRFLLLAIPCFFLVSCRTVPPLPPGEAEKVPAAFEAALPVSFTARQALVFEFKPHWWWPTVRMTALGYAAVNRKTGDYTVVCLSPLGVKLFDIGRTRGQTQARIQLPLPGDREAFAKTMGEDIAQFFFELTPPPGAVARVRGGGVVFQKPGRDEDLYEFDSSGRLIRKVVWRDGIRSVLTFSDYRQGPEGLQPRLMALRNTRYHYILTVRALP